MHPESLGGGCLCVSVCEGLVSVAELDGSSPLTLQGTRDMKTQRLMCPRDRC